MTCFNLLGASISSEQVAQPTLEVILHPISLKPLRLLVLIGLMVFLTACSTSSVTRTSSPDLHYVASVDIDSSMSQAELEATYGGQTILFKPNAGFAVLGFSKEEGELTTLSTTENQDTFSGPEVHAAAFGGNGHSAWASGHSAWASGHSAWASGWSAWAGGHSAWAGGDQIPALPASNQAAWDFINLEEAHMLSTKYGVGSVVAVIDTGLDLNHPAFEGRLAPSLQWRDFVDNDNDPSEVSGGAAYGHGTGVAGIILQIAPLAKVLPIRVLDEDGRGDTDDVLLAVEHAINMDVDVINLSLGASVSVSALRNMIELAQTAGIYTIISSGNGGGFTEMLYPARDMGISGTNTHLLNVGSVNAQGELSEFTSDSIYTVMWGSEDKGTQWYRRLEQAAPGEQIVSAYPGSQAAAYTGTSFAAPMVAGALALIKAEVSSLSFSRGYGTYISQPYLTEDYKAYTVNVANYLKRQAGWTAPATLNSSKPSQSLSGSWTRSGGQSSSSNKNPKYSFTLNQDGLVAIDLNSSSDTYLYLLDSNGNTIATDNNSGQGTNSRVFRNLSEGTYTIVAATVKKSQKTSFELKVYGDVSGLN